MSELNVERICRLCCEKKNRMRSLFEERNEYPLPLPEIMLDILRLEVNSNDGMPQKVCTWCITSLLKLYETVSVYRANDLKLRKQIDGMLQMEIKQEEEEIDLEVLENSSTHGMDVDAFCVKTEMMEEEYLETELNYDEVSWDEINVSKEIRSDDVEYEERSVIDKDDEDWKPSETDTEEKGPEMKKYRRRMKNEKDGNGKRKIGRPRTKFIDPNRPRKYDHKCYICKSESHETYEALIAHLNIHENELPFTCSECVMDTVVIKTVQKLNAHLRQHLNPEKCPYCDKRYTNKNSVSMHIKMYHEESDVQSPWPCEYCGEMFPSKVSLLHHIKLHTTAASCEICGKVFKERHKLRLHIQRRHEKVKKYQCHICHKRLASLDSVQMHLKTTHSNQVFKCSYCPKIYSSELAHRNHENKHIVNPGFVGKKDWKDYYTILEGEENKPGLKQKKCNLCGIVTKAIATHLTTIHFPNEFQCSVCDITFKNKQRFKIHVLEHENGKAHQCPICGREFSDRKNLIAHIRTKQHRDHPLAQSLDWLRINEAKSRPRKPKPMDCNENPDGDIIVEDCGLDETV